MLRRSTYSHRFLYAGIVALGLVLASAIIMLSTFVWVSDIKPITSISSITFTPVPTKPDATPVQTVYTDTEYSDAHIQIKITKVVKTNPNLVYYVADITLDSVQYFKSNFANDKYATSNYETVSSQATRHNAILAINSDDCTYGSNPPKKFTIRNGNLYNENFSDEILVLMKSGEMRIVKGVSGATLVQQGALHSWSFGPALVIDGQYVQRSSSVSGQNPRTGIGMIEPLHYIFIVVDGRRPSHSVGLAMKDFAQLFLDYGCKVAYNLDGGGSSTMFFHNKIVNVPDDGLTVESTGKERKVNDFIYIGE